MAAIGKAASKKGETSAFNLGDEGFYEDDGAGLDTDYYLEQMKRDENKEKNKVYKREPTAKELKEKAEAEEFEKRKALGLVHVSVDKLAALAAEEARLKEKKKAEKLKQMEEEEKLAQIEALRQEKIRLRRYKKSSEYKRKCWAEKVEARKKHDAEWEAVEQAHKDQEEEYRLAKDLYERQKRIDESWNNKASKDPKESPTKEPESPTQAEGAAPKPKPKPQPKGKKGKPLDLSKYGGALPPAALAKKAAEEKPAVENLPWDPEKGEKDPNRPASEKKAEEAAFEKKQRAWKKHLEDWSRIKQEHNKEVQHMKEQGLYDSEPEFRSDPDSDEEEHSDSGSDSDF